MSYVAMVEHLFDIYMLGCLTALAFALFAKDKRREALLQPCIYAIAIGLFQWRMHGKVEVMGYWWYAANLAIDLWLVFTAIGIKAPSSRYVAGFGLFASSADLVYFIAAGFNHRLPGIGYYLLSEVFESLQVLSMIIWSGPVLEIASQCWGHIGSSIKKNSKWHLRKLFHPG